MDRIKLLVIALFSCLAALASSQNNYDPQWGSATVGNVQVVSYSPNGEYILTFGNSEVRLWRASDGTLMWAKPVSNLVDAGFNPESTSVFASTDTVIKAFNVLDGSAASDFSADTNAKGYFGVSQDGAYLACTADGTTTYLFNMSGTLQTSFTTDPAGATPDIQFFQQGAFPTRLLVGASSYELDGTFVRSYGVTGGDTILPTTVVPSGSVTKIFQVEGNAGVFGSLIGQNPATGALANNINISSIGGTPRNLSAAADRRRSTIAYAGNNGALNGVVALFNYATGALLGSVATPYIGTHKSIAFSPVRDDFALVSNIGSGTEFKLELYNLTEGRTNGVRAWVKNLYSSLPITQMAIGAANATVTNTPIVVTGTTSGTGGGQVVDANTGGLARSMVDTLWSGTRPKQLSVSPDGKYLAVVYNSAGANLKVYNLQTGGSVGYVGHVTGAAFYNNTDLVVDGPSSLRVGASSVTSISYPWADRGLIVDPVVSPNLGKAALFDIVSNQVVLYNVATGAATRNTLADTLADYGFLGNSEFFTVVINNAATPPSAKINIYTTAGNVLTLKSTRTFTTTVLAGGTFNGWTATLARNGRWAAFIDSQTDSTGQDVNTVRFYNFTTLQTVTTDFPYSGKVQSAVFNAGNSMLHVGTSSGALGTLDVPVFVDSIVPKKDPVSGGEPFIVTVNMSEPGAIGGTPLIINTSSGLTPPNKVVVPFGRSSIRFQVQTNSVTTATPESIEIQTQFGSPKTINVTVNPVSIWKVTFANDPVAGGQPNTGTVHLFGKAPAGGAEVTLTKVGPVTLSSETVTVPEGQSTADFGVTTTVVGKDIKGGAKAEVNGTAKTGNFLILKPAITDLTVSASEVVGGASLIGTVTISDPAPTFQGVTVDIVSDVTGITLGTATVPKNETSVDFSIDTSVVADNTLVTLTGTSGGQDRQASFTVLSPSITGLTVDQDSVKGGTDITGTVTVSMPAPAGGMTVPLTSNHASVNAGTATVPEGSTTGTFTLSTNPVASDTLVIVMGNKNGSHWDTVIIQAPTLLSFELSSYEVTGGESVTGTVVLDSPAPEGFTVSVNIASPMTGPSSVVFTGGTTEQTFVVDTPVVESSIQRRVRVFIESTGINRWVTINP